MVGIARARGCGTCRKRKIACGLEKPVCAQCIKSKRSCPGYRKYPIFIAHKVPKDDDSNTSPLESTPDARPNTPPGSSQGSVEDCESLTLEVRCPDLTSMDLALSLPASGVVDFNPALRGQLLEVYLDHHLSKIRLGPMQQRIWLLNLPSLPQMTAALEVSIMALCFAKLGELHGDQNMTHESLKLYRRGLHQLQLALWDPDLMFHDQTLAACCALSMYEMSQCPNASKDGYLSHVTGCGKLIQLRGPEAHTEGLAHSLFVHFRIQGILYALERRQSTFLSEPAWQKVPWGNKPKTVYDEVYDFFLRAPFLLREGEMLEHMDPVSQLHLATSMISRCWEMDGDILSLYERMEKSREGPLYWPELARDKSLDDDSEDGMLFPVAFNFPNLMIANTVLIFWGVQTMLWHGMFQLYGLMHELRARFASSDTITNDNGELLTTLSTNIPANCLTDGTFELHPLGHRTDFWAPGYNVLQSVEYCLNDQTMDQGPKCIAAPLRIVIETLRPYPKHAKAFAWGERAMEKVRSRSLRLLIYYTGAEARPHLQSPDRAGEVGW